MGPSDGNLVGIIGAGHLGQAMARTARRAGIGDPGEIGIGLCLPDVLEHENDHLPVALIWKGGPPAACSPGTVMARVRGPHTGGDLPSSPAGDQAAEVKRTKIATRNACVS